MKYFLWLAAAMTLALGGVAGASPIPPTPSGTIGGIVLTNDSPLPTQGVLQFGLDVSGYDVNGVVCTFIGAACTEYVGEDPDLVAMVHATCITPGGCGSLTFTFTADYPLAGSVGGALTVGDEASSPGPWGFEACCSPDFVFSPGDELVISGLLNGVTIGPPGQLSFTPVAAPGSIVAGISGVSGPGTIVHAGPVFTAAETGSLELGYGQSLDFNAVLDFGPVGPTSAIPEPSTYGILLIGVGVLALMRKRMVV
jgi:PEP-CTERM motif